MTRRKEARRHHGAPAGTAGRRARARRTRALHLVDVDNLLGDPGTADHALITATVAAYRRLAAVEAGDHVTVACAALPHHALAVHTAWPGVRHCWRSGADGADLALLEVAEWAVEVDGFARAVIGSGDRIFLHALEVLEGAGIPVEVVARPRALAAALRTRARSVRFLPEVAMGLVA